MSMRAGLQRAAARGLGIQTVIDIGASDGRWTAVAREYWPAASFLLIEANVVHEPALRELKRGAAAAAGETEHNAGAKPRGGVDYALVAAGARDGETWFERCADPFGGVAAENPPPASAESSATTVANWVRLPMRCVDSLVTERGLKPPYLLKLDTHGFEVPIFEGAAATLAQTALIIVEAYNFTIAPGCLRFHELIAYLEQRGFRCADMCDVSRRPRDEMLWQMDLVLAPAERLEFQHNEFQVPNHTD
jgi:FkbM family methyltransferase